jgi:hypothetical protein
MGIAQQKISYAIGNAAWGSKAQQEGLRVRGHSEPEPQFVSPQRPQVVSSEPLPNGQDARVGALWYLWDLPTIFSPAHGCLLLDKLFESVSVGASPYYLRTYIPTQIPREPISPYLNVWKKTGKTGLDHNMCCYNGLVAGVSLSKEPEQAVMLTARSAFGARSLIEANPAHWEIDWTGDTTAVKEGDILIAMGPPGESQTEYPVTAFNLSFLCEVTPYFWGAQNPDRFVRSAPRLSGELTFRDKASEIEDFTAALEQSLTKSIYMSLGVRADLNLTVQFDRGAGMEDDRTRHGKFSFTGVCDSAADAPGGFSLTLAPYRLYTP